MTIPKLLTEKEAAEFLSVSQGTLRNYRYMHIGPNYVKIGRRICYKPEDLQRYVEEHYVRVE